MIRLLLRLVLTAAAVAAVLEAGTLYGMSTAASKVSPALQQELGDGSYVYSVKVDLGFPPEYYHIRKLQSVGTVAGVSGYSVRVLELTPDQVHDLAQLYWVKRLEPLDDTKA